MEFNTDSAPVTPNLTSKMKKVTKRDSTQQSFDVQKIYKRLEKLSFEIYRKYVNLELIVKKIEQGLYDGIKTSEIDNLAAETSAYMNIIHPHYSLLAARIAVDNLHKETKESFAETVKDLFNYVDKSGN